MNDLSRDARRFRHDKAVRERQARQTAAFFLVSGIDLGDALASTGTERARIVARIVRLVERERLKGIRRHWSYDLNRHIALKQALDRLLDGHGQTAAHTKMAPEGAMSEFVLR